MSRVVKIGKIKIGGNNPVRIKGMLKTPYCKLKVLIKEAQNIENQGAEVIRMAVREKNDIAIFKVLKNNISVPVVADIHFNPVLAFLAIDAGFEGIRLNPLNIIRKKDVQQIAKIAKDKGVSIRVGVNSGGFKQKFSSPKHFAVKMVNEALRYIEFLEDKGFFDIMVSLKGADVQTTIIANRIFSQKSDYPLHLGITASGPFASGLVKSSIGLGCLLGEGIGSVIRVSLTAPSFQEITAAKDILSALGLRKFGPEIISCPTCSRCEVNLINIVNKFQEEISSLPVKGLLKVALMGCVVNGPGEAQQADIGVAFGKKKAVIFRKNKILRQSSEKNIIADLKREINKIWN